MHYTPIRMNNGKLLFQFSSGITYLTPANFGYHQVCHELPITYERFLELTALPPLPNGVFYAYIDGNTLYATHTTNSSTECFILSESTFKSTSSIPKLPVAGAFTSLEELSDYFPEFFI